MLTTENDVYAYNHVIKSSLTAYKYFIEEGTVLKPWINIKCPYICNKVITFCHNVSLHVLFLNANDKLNISWVYY